MTEDLTIQVSVPQVFDVTVHLWVTTHQWHENWDDEHFIHLCVITSNRKLHQKQTNSI